MAISLKNPQVEQALQELVAETGESLTQAAGVAFRERLERLRAERAKAAASALSSIMDLIEEARRSPPLDPRPLKEVTDELWGE